MQSGTCEPMELSGGNVLLEIGAAAVRQVPMSQPGGVRVTLGAVNIAVSPVGFQRENGDVH